MNQQPEQFSEEEEEDTLSCESRDSRSSMAQSIHRQSFYSDLMFCAMLLAAIFSAISAPAQTQPAITPNGLEMPLQNPTGTVTGASITRLGNPGKSTVYYWLAANSLVGQGALAGPFPLSNAPAEFSTSYALASGTYTSGITASGTIGQTCNLSNFNHGSTATATVALTGLNTIASGTVLDFQSFGTGATAAATTASSSNGTASCSGTAAVSTVLGHNYSSGAQLNWLPVNGALTYDCLKTATAAAPAGTGNYAVATGLTSTTCSDTGQALTSYTVAPVNTAGLKILLQNQATGNDASCLAANGVCIAGQTVYYQTAQNNGTALPQELAYDFIGFTVSDDPANGRTQVTAPSPATVYYQTVEADGAPPTPAPQRPALNFFSDFLVADDVPKNSTDITLPTQGGLTPGTYCQVTVNNKGLVTAATACPIDYYFSFTGCTLPAGADSKCIATSPSFSVMPDANYIPLCSADTNTAIGGNNADEYFVAMAVSFTSGTPPGPSLTQTNFTYNLGATVMAPTLPFAPIIYCHLHHN